LGAGSAVVRTRALTGPIEESTSTEPESKTVAWTQPGGSLQRLVRHGADGKRRVVNAQDA
jgi:hypothetical protein